MADTPTNKPAERAILMARAFYHDFMPMVQQIKNDVAALHIDEQDKETLDRINEQLRQVESSLRQLMTITTKKEPKNEQNKI